MFRFALLFTFSIVFLFSVEEVPKEIKKTMDSYDKVYEKALSSAQRSIDKEKEKALKALDKELTKAKRRDLELVEKIKKQIAEIKALPTLLEMETDSKKTIEVIDEELVVDGGVKEEDDSGFFDGIENSDTKSSEEYTITYDESVRQHNKIGLGKIEDFPNFDKYSKMYGIKKQPNDNIHMHFDKHPEIIQWIKDNKLVFSNDFLKEKYPELYKKGVRVDKFVCRKPAINGVSILQGNRLLFHKKVNPGEEINVNFIDFYKKAKASLSK